MIKFSQSHFKISLLLIVVVFLSSSCSGVKKILSKKEEVSSNEFENLVKIEDVEIIEKTKGELISQKGSIKQVAPKPKIKATTVTKKVSKKIMKKVEKPNVPTETKAIEKEELPAVEKEKPKEKIVTDVLKENPFVVGEKTKIEVSYLNMIAGYLTLETKGVAKVNGRLSYHFRGSIKSRKLFSFIYSVDDVADTYVDVENLRPYSLVFKVIETKKTKNSKTYFDWSKMKATYWSKKTKKGRKPKEKKKVWDILEGSQNFVSALFYLRTIDFSANKEFSFPMADEGKSIILISRAS